ncbi:hypothetical protein L7F22_006574 [Adiantum nelumboides]|nr:hypothetical protein [Adiantum nelumboides]
MSYASLLLDCILPNLFTFLCWNVSLLTRYGKSYAISMKDTDSNKVFLMQKLFILHMQESAIVASHINDFDSLFVQIRAQCMNMDDEMKAIFLLFSLPPSWDIFCTAISNYALNGTLVYNDVTSSLLSKKMRQKSMGSSHHGEAHYVQRSGKQRKGHVKQRDASKDGKRDSFCSRSKSRGCYKNMQCHYCEIYGHMKKLSCLEA